MSGVGSHFSEGFAVKLGVHSPAELLAVPLGAVQCSTVHVAGCNVGVFLDIHFYILVCRSVIG